MILGLPPLLFAGAVASYAAARGLFMGYPAKVVARGHLSGKEQAIVAACADAFFPKNGPIPISGTEANLVYYLDEYVAHLPSSQGVLIRLLLWFIEHGPWAFGPMRIRFTSLPLAEQHRVLDGMRTSPIYFRRVAFLSMRTMLTMGYLAHPDVMRAMRLSHSLDPFARSEVAEPPQKTADRSTFEQKEEGAR